MDLSVQTRDAKKPGVLRHAYILGVPEHGNLGDHQIAESCREFLLDVLPGIILQELPIKDYASGRHDLLRKVKPDDILVFLGGGFFGNLWPMGDELRKDAFRLFPDQLKIVFPQSVWYSDDEAGREAIEDAKQVYDNANALFAFRDPVSFEIAKKNFNIRAFLTPDIVMYTGKASDHGNPAEKRRGILAMMRSDKEKLLTGEEQEKMLSLLKGLGGPVSVSDMHLGHGVGSTERKAALDLKFEEVRTSSLVVTDRLHGVLFSAVTGTPCIAFGNHYHKISASGCWLKDLPYIQFAGTPEEACKEAEELLSMKDTHYPAEQKNSLFDEFASAIKAAVPDNTVRTGTDPLSRMIREDLDILFFTDNPLLPCSGGIYTGPEAVQLLAAAKDPQVWKPRALVRKSFLQHITEETKAGPRKMQEWKLRAFSAYLFAARTGYASAAEMPSEKQVEECKTVLWADWPSSGDPCQTAASVFRTYLSMLHEISKAEQAPAPACLRPLAFLSPWPASNVICPGGILDKKQEAAAVRLAHWVLSDARNRYLKMTAGDKKSINADFTPEEAGLFEAAVAESALCAAK